MKLERRREKIWIVFGKVIGISLVVSTINQLRRPKCFNNESLSSYSREYFTFIGSIVYAMLLIVIGCVINAQDIFVEGHKRGSRHAQVMNVKFGMYTI